MTIATQPLKPTKCEEHLGRQLCGDCYMVTFSPMKTCDPWAVHSAKTYEKHAGDERSLTPLQQAILKTLKDEGPLEPTALQPISCTAIIRWRIWSGTSRPCATWKKSGGKTGTTYPVAIMVGRRRVLGAATRLSAKPFSSRDRPTQAKQKTRRVLTPFPIKPKNLPQIVREHPGKRQLLSKHLNLFQEKATFARQ